MHQIALAAACHQVSFLFLFKDDARDHTEGKRARVAFEQYLVLSFQENLAKKKQWHVFTLSIFLGGSWQGSLFFLTLRTSQRGFSFFLSMPTELVTMVIG